MKLSVFVVTYNQEKYIRQCLDSILMQKVSFDYEVIVGEDCSTDSTPQICDEYAAKYPFIKIYHHPKNIGLVKNWEFVLNKCTGDYVAMIEGDDYWVDPNKLQIQIDWLDNHPDYVITSTNVKVLCEDGLDDGENWFPNREEGEVDISEYLEPGICHTTSVVMRNVLMGIRYPSWVYMTDTYTFMLAAQRGKAYHFSEKMSVYRRHMGNCTSSSFSNIISMMLLATQHREMQDIFPEQKILIQKYDDELESLSHISRHGAPSDLWKYRIRYILKHKKLIFSKFAVRTIMYLPIFLKS